MDDRRGFLGRLLTFCGVAAVAPNVMALPGPKRDEADEPPTLLEMKRFTALAPNRFVYKGFVFFWTGWKPCLGMDVYVCQWCAYEGASKHDPNGRHFYASYPGATLPYWPGEVFDISIKEGQKAPMWGTPEAEKERYRLECLQRLMRLIDKNVAVAE